MGSGYIQVPSGGGSSLPSGTDGDILVHSGGSWQGTQTADLLANSLQCEETVSGGSVTAGALTATAGSDTSQVEATSITMNTVEVTRDHLAGIEAANPSASSPVALLSQATIHSAAQASRPATLANGQEFCSTDGCGPNRQIYNSGTSAYDYYYLGLKCSPVPTAASLSQIHFSMSAGTASLADGGPCIIMSQTGNNSTTARDLSAAVAAIPASGAYSLDVGMDIAQIGEGFTMNGLCVTDGNGATPKMLCFLISQGNGTSTTPTVYISKETNPTTNNTATGRNIPLVGGGGRIFIRFSDDRTTNLSWWISHDGNNWVRWYQEARTAFLTPAYVGLCCAQQGSVLGGAIATTVTRSIVKAYHWKLG